MIKIHKQNVLQNNGPILQQKLSIRLHKRGHKDELTTAFENWQSLIIFTMIQHVYIVKQLGLGCD
jgi:hypothetical protein